MFCKLHCKTSDLFMCTLHQNTRCFSSESRTTRIPSVKTKTSGPFLRPLLSGILCFMKLDTFCQLLHLKMVLKSRPICLKPKLLANSLTPNLFQLTGTMCHIGVCVCVCVCVLNGFAVQLLVI